MARQTQTHAENVERIFGQPAGPARSSPAARSSTPARRSPGTPARRSSSSARSSSTTARSPRAPRQPSASAQRRQAAHRRAVIRSYSPRIARPLRSNYQPVILAEFVAAILLTATTPIATRKDSTGLSPYKGQDMLQLAAITAVYLILALMSAGGRGPGRFAAWFGALILLTVGLGQAAGIAKELDLFGIGGAPQTSDSTPAPTGGGPAPKAA